MGIGVTLRGCKGKGSPILWFRRRGEENAEKQARATNSNGSRIPLVRVYSICVFPCRVTIDMRLVARGRPSRAAPSKLFPWCGRLSSIGRVDTLGRHRLSSGVASEARRASGSGIPDHGQLGEGRELTIMGSPGARWRVPIIWQEEDI
jgi:hypothetical protein